MKRKSSKVSLSPNEEAQVVREELQRRRKLRLQQVREQERSIALQVRREVQERRERELRSLATALRDEWRAQRGERIQTLEKLYKETLRDVGQGQRHAEQNEPDREALALRKEQNDTRAAERHQKALRNLITQRQAEAEQRNRHIDARKKALMVEKERAARIASLPQSAPDPIESLAIQTSLQPKMSSVEHYSITHHHIPETAVDREPDTVQPDAQEAAALEARRLEELEKEERRDRQEQLERARLRGDHALRKEKGAQDSARLLCELERLQQAELQRRRRVVSSVPALIFQPLYRHDDLRAEQQRDLEIAFQDLCTEDKEIRDDLVFQTVSEPLPPPVPSVKTDGRPECDLDLDVTLEPKETPCEEEDEEEEPAASQSQSIGERSRAPAEGTGRTALRRLLDRIRTQRDQWSRREPAEGEGRIRVENTSDEHGSPSNLEWQQASSLEEGTVDTSLAENNSKASEDSIVAGPVLQPDEQITEMDGRIREEELKRQQQEQFALLQELEEKQRSLELQLEEAQLCRQRLQDALQVPSGMSSLQETPPPPPSPPQDVVSEPSNLSEAKVSAPLSDSMHIQRLQQYQQRLLTQNRIHKKTIDDACRRLEEYKQTLRTRYAPVTVTAAQTPPPSANEETVRFFPSLPHGTLTTAITPHVNNDTGSPISPETPVVNKKQSYDNIALADPTLLSQPPLPTPTPALTTHPDTRVMAQLLSAPIGISHSVHEDGSALIPHPAASSLLDKRLSDGTSEHPEVPLLPPAVFLEYLRSRRSQAPPTHLTPVSQQVSKDPGAVLQEEVESSLACWGSEMETNQQVRERIRKQREALRELLRAQHAEEQSVSLGMHDSAVKAYEESDEPVLGFTAPSQSHAHNQQTPGFESSGSPVSAEHFSPCESASGARVNPPVSCPPRTLQILLHDFEQHKLSTIEEVDTPGNVTMDTAAEACTESSSAERSGYSNSCTLSLSPPTTGSGSSQEPGSGVTWSEDSTLKPSKLSWREMLQLESAASRAGTNSTEQQQVEELELVLPHDGASGVPDFLSSTTLSTGSYFSSEHDPNFNITDSSLLSNEFPTRSGASLTCSSSLCGFSFPKTADSSLCSNSLQHIIDKYTKELDKSLRSVHTGGSVSVVTAQENGNTGSSFCAEQNSDAGTLTAPQLPTLPLQCNLEDSNSLNTTMQDTFQSLSPEITNNDMTECSSTLQLPLNPPLEDSDTNTDTTASDWLDRGLPQHSSTTDDQSSSASASASAGFPQWEWTLGNNSELRNLEACVSHEGEVSRIQNADEATICTLPRQSLHETGISESTDGTCSQLEEVEHRRELRSCHDAYAKNREKAKEFRMKTLEKLRAKQR